VTDAQQDEVTDDLRERLAAAASVDSQALSMLAAQADVCRKLDRLLGARAAQPQLNGYLQMLGVLRTHTLGNRDGLADLYSDAAALAGWQCVDLGQLSDAWNHYEAAKSAGREGRSLANLAHAMAEQAYVLVELEDTASALQLVEHACSVAKGKVPPLLLAWLSAVQGEIYAVAGNDRLSREAFESAQKCLPENDCSDPDLPYVILSEVHLSRWRGNAWAKLGDIGAIEELQISLASLDRSFVRARAGLHVDLAYALTAAKLPGQAQEQLAEATTYAARVGSVRQRRRIRKLQSALASA
jgi:tetratricopeptide (TPR) repeat protein